MTRRRSISSHGSNSGPASPVSGWPLAGRPVPKLRTTKEAADILNVSERTVRRLISRGGLPVHRLGRSVRISDADIGVLLAATRSV